MTTTNPRWWDTRSLFARRSRAAPILTRATASDPPSLVSQVELFFSIEIFLISFWSPRFRFLGRYFAKIDHFSGVGHPGYGYHEAPCVKHKVLQQNENHENDNNNDKQNNKMIEIKTRCASRVLPSRRT